MKDRILKAKNSIILTLISILLICFVGIGGYFINKSHVDKMKVEIDNEEKVIDEEENNEDKDNLQIENLESVNVNSNVVQNLINKLSPFNTLSVNYENESNEYYGILYKQNKLLTKSLPAEIKTYVVASNFNLATEVEVEDGTSCLYKISNTKFKEKYYQIFGQNTNYDINEYDFVLPSVDIEGDSILLSGCRDDINRPGYYIHKQIVKAEKSNQELYLYENIAIADETNKVNTGKYNFYSDIEHKNMIAKSISENEIFASKYIDQLSQYKYTFKLEDGNYYFYSIEKIK